ncbi:response regulator transcription factor [Fluviicola taffensis]|uniref:LytR/AlgR family response regulator transcription factor n=1 Tax=Fluviicola taffensis TaxID=191579 RepID=UPI0031377D9A
MEKIKILIVEDTVAESDKLIGTLTSSQFEVVGVARSHQEALQLFYANKVDIVVIDIFLNGIPEGITFAETLNNVPESARPFVFLTSSTDRTIFERARLTKPYSFLLKPFNPLEVLYALEMAIEKFYDQPDIFQGDEEDTVISSDFLFIKKKDALKKVAVSDIIHIEVEERYCSIFAGPEKFVIQISLAKITNLLDSSRFHRVHRNHIVNAHEIEEIQPSDGLLVMSNKSIVPISDHYKDVLNQFKIIK